MMENTRTRNLPFPLLYGGSIAYYALWLQGSGFFDTGHSFVKQTALSRCRILGPAGVQTLSVPIVKSSREAMSKVRISYDEDWQKRHWASLETAYNNSPFFMYYEYLFRPLFFHKVKKLAEFNSSVHQAIIACLELDLKPEYKSEPITPDINDPRRLFITKKSHPQASLLPIYQQVFSYDKPFVPDLSVLDALFNLGPQTLTYLEHCYESLIQTTGIP